MKKSLILLSVSAMLFSNACTPLGMATGAAASVGNAASKEGGISGAVTDASIKGKINELRFNYNIDTFFKALHHRQSGARPLDRRSAKSARPC